MKLWKKLWKRVHRLWTELDQCFPPGYEFTWERNTAAVLLALSMVLSPVSYTHLTLPTMATV